MSKKNQEFRKVEAGPVKHPPGWSPEKGEIVETRCGIQAFMFEGADGRPIPGLLARIYAASANPQTDEALHEFSMPLTNEVARDLGVKLIEMVGVCKVGEIADAAERVAAKIMSSDALNSEH